MRWARGQVARCRCAVCRSPDQYLPLLVTRVPAELHIFVAVVDDLERGSLGLANDAVADDKLVFKVVGQAFKCDALVEAFTH